MQVPDICSAPPLPPPPLPPSVSSFSTKHVERKSLETKKTYFTVCVPASDHERLAPLKALIHFREYFVNCKESMRLLSHENPTHSVLQNGPTCGIVALSMSSMLLNHVDVDSLLQRAKALNFTKQGEMFSADSMASLASDMLKCESEILIDLQSHKNLFIEHILSGYPMLIPYDEDKNHEPCCKRGHKAHWAVVSGICLIFESLNEKKSDSFISVSEDFLRSMNTSLTKDDVKAIMLQLEDIDQIFFYCRQGKSRHLAAWDLDDIIASNNNLFEYGKKYGSDGEEILGGDDLSGLRNKIILLKPSTSQG